MEQCKGCGRKIIWGVTETGASVPLDPRALVMFKPADGSRLRKQKEAYTCFDDSPEKAGMVQIPGQWVVSHFATCPQANQFSGQNKEPKNGE